MLQVKPIKKQVHFRDAESVFSTEDPCSLPFRGENAAAETTATTYPRILRKQKEGALPPPSPPVTLSWKFPKWGKRRLNFSAALFWAGLPGPSAGSRIR